MTCREKLMLEHPNRVDEKWTGGCFNCPDTYDYLPDPDYCEGRGVPTLCRKCWDREIPGTEDKKNLPYDIYKLIDDCIAKKDRYITIFTTDIGTKVSVYPLLDANKEDR